MLTQTLMSCSSESPSVGVAPQSHRGWHLLSYFATLGSEFTASEKLGGTLRKPDAMSLGGLSLPSRLAGAAKHMRSPSHPHAQLCLMPFSLTN